jgi:hypothetical protein
MGARNQVGIGLSYRPAKLPRLAEFVPWNQFLGSINVLKYRFFRARTQDAIANWTPESAGTPALAGKHGISSNSKMDCNSGTWAAIQRRGSILSWIAILSVYGAVTIAIDLSLSALISLFMKSIIGF